MGRTYSTVMRLMTDLANAAKLEMATVITEKNVLILKRL
jgi:hypothetical protein